MRRILPLALILLLALLPEGSARIFPGGGEPGGGGGTTVGSLSFVNNGSGTSPGPSGMTPIHPLKTFRLGDVPVGMIAVPSVGGVAIPYGVDCAVDGVNPLRSDGCPSWPDGSLKAIPVSLYVPQLSAGGTTQVVWTTQAGSYSTTSTVRPSDVIAASDYNVVLTGVNSAWVPQYYSDWPDGVQVGCGVSGGAVTSCTLRITPPSSAITGPETCADFDFAPGTFTASIDDGSGGAGNTLHVTAGNVSTGSWLRGSIITDNTSTIAPDTVITAEGTGTGTTGTYTVSGAPQLVASEAMGFRGCSGRINNGPNSVSGNAIFDTTRGANNLPTSVTLISGGSGYSTIGGGTLKFDMNTLLALYGSIQPPTCAAEQGAGVFAANYSGSGSTGALTTTSVTSGHIATGQVVKDATGATAVVTGTSSPWTVSAPLASGAMTANTPVCVWAQSSYAGQPLKTSYWVFGPYIDTGTGLPDPQLMGAAQVDIWSLGGSTYSVRAIIRTDRDGWQPGQWWSSYTYNADIKNGTAKVRGNAQGAGIYTNITDEVPGDWWTADPALSGPLGASARMDWLGATNNSFSESNSLALNAVSMYLASSDVAYWRKSGVMLPMSTSPAPSPLIIPVSTTNGSWDNPYQYQAQYMPFGPIFTDTQAAFGSGGDHFFLTPQSTQLEYWIDAQVLGASDKGVSWLNQMRVAGLALSGDVSGADEADTGHALNIDPNFSNSAFTDPLRAGSQLAPTANAGHYVTSVPSGQMAVGGQANQHGELSDTSHWPSGIVWAPYLVDGEYYQLKQMDNMAVKAPWSNYDTGNRKVTFGGNTYYGVVWNNIAPRVWAWGAQLMEQFATYAPPQEPDAQYWNWVLNQDNYQSLAAFYPYRGSWTLGGGQTGTKSYDWTTGGTCSAQLIPAKNLTVPPYFAGDVDFMCAYSAMQLLLAQEHAGGPGHNTALDVAVTEAVDNFFVKAAAANSCAFNVVNYGQGIGNTATGQPPDTYDWTTIPGSAPNNAGQQSSAIVPSNALQTISGNNNVTYIQSTQYGPKPNSGSILNPTNWFVHNEGPFQPNPPAPFSIGTWYEWCSQAAPASFVGSIVGANLTVSSVTGTIAVDQFISGITVPANTYYITGGGPTVWTLNASPGTTVSQPMTVSDTYFTGTTDGTTAAVAVSGLTGALSVGEYIAGAGITANMFYITGGGPSTYTLSGVPAAAGPENMTVVPNGTINAYGTSCASPSPLTPAATAQFNVGWIMNQSCPTPGYNGDWGFPQDFGATGYATEYWAIFNWRAAVGGPTLDTTAAINLFAPLMGGGQSFFANPRWNACDTYTC